MSNTIRDILTFGQEVIARQPCSESDIVYHLLAPLLETVGWHKIEIHFERDAKGSIPDITLILHSSQKVILTVEAKAPAVSVGLYEEGWSRSMRVQRKSRVDLPYQVFNQLIHNGHSDAWLSNGHCFLLFTLRQDTEQLYRLSCLYSATLSKLLESDTALLEFKNLLSRKTYCEDNRAALTKKENFWASRTCHRFKSRKSPNSRRTGMKSSKRGQQLLRAACTRPTKAFGPSSRFVSHED